MAVQRLDNVAIVVSDLDASIAFFVELGLEVENRQHVSGKFAEDATGVDDLHSEIAMLVTPDGASRLELTTYHAPAAIVPDPAVPPANTLGLHRVMFAVDDIRDTVGRLGRHGGEVVREIGNYEGVFLLCYLRGPDGIIVGLAEQIGSSEQ